MRKTKTIVLSLLLCVLAIGCGKKNMCQYANCKNEAVTDTLCAEHLKAVMDKLEDENTVKYDESDFIGDWQSNHKYDSLEKEYIEGQDGDDIEFFYVFNSDGTVDMYIHNNEIYKSVVKQRAKWSINDGYIDMVYQGQTIDSLEIKGSNGNYTLVAPYDSRIQCKKINRNLYAPKTYID